MANITEEQIRAILNLEGLDAKAVADKLDEINKITKKWSETIQELDAKTKLLFATMQDDTWVEGWSKSLEYQIQSKEVLGEINSATEKERFLRDEITNQLQRELESLVQSQKQKQQAVAIQQEIIAGLEEEGDKAQELIAANEKLEELQESLKTIHEGVSREKIKQLALTVRQNEAQSNLADQTEDMIGSLTGIGDQWKNTFVGAVVEAGSAAEGLGPKLAAMGKGLAEGIKVALTPMNILMSTLQKVAEMTVMMVFEVDEASKAFARSQGTGVEYNKVINEAYQINKDYSLSVSENSEAMAAARSSMSTLATRSKDTVAAIGTFIAPLENIGVQSEVAAESMDILMNTFGQSVEEAEATTKSMIGLAGALKQPPNVVLKEFAAMAPKLAVHGKNAEKVFENLKIKASQTGVEVSRLVEIAEGFDTFEDAGRKVGQLNAILGGAVFQSQEFMQATDPEERIRILQDGFAATGKSFDDMSYYQRKAVASAMGFKDVGEASRMLSMSAAERAEKEAEATKVMKEKAKQEADMQQLMKDGITVAKKFTQMMKNLGEAFMPIIEALHGILDAMLPVFKLIGGAISTIAGFVGGLNKMTGGLLGWAAGFAAVGFAGFKLFGFLGGFFGKMTGWIGTLSLSRGAMLLKTEAWYYWTRATEAASGALSFVTRGFKSFGGIMTKAISWLTSGTLATKAMTAALWLKNGAVKAVSAGWGFVSGAAGKAISFIRSGTLMTKAGTAALWLKNIALKAVSLARFTHVGRIATAIGALTSLVSWEKVSTGALWLKNKAIGAVKGSWSLLTGALGTAKAAVMGWFGVETAAETTNAAAKAANTGATGLNTAAKTASTTATVAETGAKTANTAAIAANTTATWAGVAAKLAYGAAALMILFGVALVVKAVAELAVAMKDMGASALGMALVLGVVMGGLYLLVPAIIAAGGAAGMAAVPMLALGAAVLMVSAGVAGILYVMSLLIDSFAKLLEIIIPAVPEVLALSVAMIPLAVGMALAAPAAFLLGIGMGLLAVGWGLFAAALAVTSTDDLQAIGEIFQGMSKIDMSAMANLPGLIDDFVDEIEEVDIDKLDSFANALNRIALAALALKAVGTIFGGAIPGTAAEAAPTPAGGGALAEAATMGANRVIAAAEVREQARLITEATITTKESTVAMKEILAPVIERIATPAFAGGARGPAVPAKVDMPDGVLVTRDVVVDLGREFDYKLKRKVEKILEEHLEKKIKKK
jgi:hypothetical protein